MATNEQERPASVAGPFLFNPHAVALAPAHRTARVGALAIGAVALGAIAIGALAIGRLTIGRARFGKVEIDDLTVRRLKVLERL